MTESFAKSVFFFFTFVQSQQGAIFQRAHFITGGIFLAEAEKIIVAWQHNIFQGQKATRPFVPEGFRDGLQDLLLN